MDLYVEVYRVTRGFPKEEVFLRVVTDAPRRSFRAQ